MNMNLFSNEPLNFLDIMSPSRRVVSGEVPLLSVSSVEGATLLELFVTEESIELKYDDADRAEIVAAVRRSLGGRIA